MTDNENLDDADSTKWMSDYAKQRAKHREELEAKDATIASLRAEIKENKKAFFKNTLTSQGYKWDFEEFADKYADNLGLDEMVALYKWAYGNPGNAEVQVPQADPYQSQEQQQPAIGPKSIIWQNPIGEHYKGVQDMSIDELKEYGRQHPEIFHE